MKKAQTVEFSGHRMPIVADGAIATVGFGDGKLIPVLIIDASNDPAISELVRIHEFGGCGDVEHTWGKQPGKTGNITLLLSFARPFEFSGIIEFDIETQGCLVDQIIRAKGFWLFAGKPGDQFRDLFPSQKSVLVEVVTDLEFLPKWTELLLDSIYKRYRRNGLSRSNAKKASEDFVGKWRAFGGFRVSPAVAEVPESDPNGN